MGVFGKRRELKDTVIQQQKELNSLTEKSFSRIFWNSKGGTFEFDGVNLFDFNKDEEIYKAINVVPELASTLNYISKSFSTGIYQELKQNSDVIERSKLVSLLNNPNPFYSGSEFKQKIATELFAFGRVHIYMNTPSIPLNTKSIFVLPTHLTKPYIGKDVKRAEIYDSVDDIVMYYEVDLKNGNVLKIPAEKVITITLNTDITFTDDGYINYISPLLPLQDALKVTPAIYDSLQELNNNRGMIGYFSNKTKSDAGLPITLKDNEKNILQQALKKYGTRKSQNKFGVVSNNVAFERITDPIKDMFFPEQKKLIKETINDILGFDSVLLNNDDSSKYGVFYKEARKSLFTENIIPAASNYTESLTSYFGLYINLDYTHLDIYSEDEKEKAETTSEKATYIRELNESVSLNQMTRESAIYFLTLEGYSEEEANNLISEKNETEIITETIEEN